MAKKSVVYWRAPSLRGRIVVPPELVRELREAMGLTQPVYARALGISQPRMQRLERTGVDPFDRLALLGDLLTRGRLTLNTVTFYNLLSKLEATQFTLPLFSAPPDDEQVAS